MSEPNDLEARKNELFATMTLIKAAKRDLAVMQSNGGDQLPLIDKLADLESDRERLAHEVNSQYMYRNLQAFMNRIDAYDMARKNEAGGILAAVEEFSMRLKKHDDEIANLTVVVAEHKADHESRIISLEDYRADMQAFREALAALSARVDSALPTEADRVESAQIRVDEAERQG